MYNLVIGLDISKSTVDATLVKWGIKEHFHGAFLNKKFGFKQMLKWLNSYNEEEDKILFCMEHTGHYGHKLCLFLKQQDYAFTQINPLKIKRSMGLRREKSDKADSLVIAMYGLKFQEELTIGSIVEEEFLDLLLLLAHRIQCLR
jgi:transposase